MRQTVIVGHKQVFPNDECSGQEFRSLLRSLDQEQLLLAIARLNHIVSQPDTTDRLELQSQALRLISPGEEAIDRINGAARRYEDPRAVGVVFRGQLLELLRWVLVYSPSRNGRRAMLDGSSLLRALLLSSEVWGRRVFSGMPTDDEAREPTEDVVMAVLRRQAIENALLPVAPILFGRSDRLYRCHLLRTWPEFGSLFEKETGLTLDQHLAVTVGLLSLYAPIKGLEPPKDGGVLGRRTVGTNTKLQQEVTSMLDGLTTSLSSLRNKLWAGHPTEPFECPPGLPLIPLYSRPVLALDEKRALVVDPVSFSYQLQWSVVFRLRDLPGADVNRRFGTALEAYCRELLERAFPRSGVLGSRTEYNVKLRRRRQVTGELDAVIRYATAAIIFEVKTTWIAEALLVPGREGELLESIDDHLIERKGVSQLAKALSHVAAASQETRPECLRGVETALPVLVVHLPGVDSVLRARLVEAFARRLGAEDWRKPVVLGGKTGLRVGGLVVLSVDEIEGLESLVAESDLAEALVDYVKKRSDPGQSLNEWLSGQDGPRLRYNEWLLEVGSDAIERSQRLLIGRSRER